MNIVARRAQHILDQLNEFKRQVLKEEEELEYRHWVEGLIEGAALAIERITE